MATTALQSRITRVFRLDAQVFEEIEADPTALRPALAIVVLSGLAAGIGSFAQQGIFGLIVATLAAILGWYVWAFLAYIIGTKLLPEPQTKSNYGELLRTLGFAAAPGMIRVFGIIPGLFPILSVVSAIWMLIAMVLAIRQALDYTSTLRAVGVCLIGWVAQVLVIGAVIALFSATAA